MVHHAGKRVRPVLPVFESDCESRLVVLRVVVPVGLHGDVGPVRGGAAGGLVAGERGCGEGEEGEGEDLETHFEGGLDGVSGGGGRRENRGEGGVVLFRFALEEGSGVVLGSVGVVMLVDEDAGSVR